MRERERFEIEISVISLRRTEPWVDSDIKTLLFILLIQY